MPQFSSKVDHLWNKVCSELLQKINHKIEGVASQKLDISLNNFDEHAAVGCTRLQNVNLFRFVLSFVYFLFRCCFSLWFFFVFVYTMYSYFTPSAIFIERCRHHVDVATGSGNGHLGAGSWQALPLPPVRKLYAFA